MTESDVQILLTWPLHLIRVPKIFWCRDKHLGIGDRRPERNHIKSPVMSDGSIFLRVHNFTCVMVKQDVLFSTHLIKDHPLPHPPILMSTDIPGWCLLSHSSKMASVKVCSSTKMGSLGER